MGHIDGVHERGPASSAPASPDAGAAAGASGGGPPGSLREHVLHSLEAVFMDAINMAHYQTDYTTKAGPIAGDLGVLHAQSTGLKWLRLQQKAEEEAEAEGEEDVDGARAAAAARRSGRGGVLES